jgi:phage protein D
MPETPLSPMAVYSARPTVRVAGREDPMLTELMVAMTMTETEGGLSALELRVGNLAGNTRGSADLAFEDDRVLKLGTAVAIYGGDEAGPQEIFRGLVSGLEADFPRDGAPELVVLAEDVLQKARLARRTAVHKDVSISDLAGRVAQQLGLRPVVTGYRAKVGTWVQWNESDLAFLRRLLRRYDGDLQVVGAELHVSPRPEVSRGTIDLELHGQLRRARALADLAHQVTEVTVSGWDPVQGKRVSSRSTGAQPGPGAGRTGAQVLRDVFGPRSEHVDDVVVTTDEEARAVADAAFDRAARGFVRVEATAEGNPALRVGSRVRLSGLGGRFDNDYYVRRACHRFDLAAGYETDFEAECAFLGAGR